MLEFHTPFGTHRGRRVIACNAIQSVKAKVRNVSLEFIVNEDVWWFNVTMDKFSWTAFMEVGQASGCSLGNFQPCWPWEAWRWLATSPYKNTCTFNSNAGKLILSIVRSLVRSEQCGSRKWDMRWLENTETARRDHKFPPRQRSYCV